MPCFNVGSYVADALYSVLAQTWKNLEVVAVNDGSTDNTLEVLRGFEACGVKIIDQDNRGQCSAANKAFEASTGELVKFFDADDIMSPEHIELQVNRLGPRRDAIAMSEWERFYKDPSGAIFKPLRMYRDADPIDWLAEEWKNAQPMMQCGIWLIPRSILTRVGLWDERLSLINDFEFFARVLLGAKELLYTPGAHLYYRSGRPGSLSARMSRQDVESAFLSIMMGTQHLLNAEDSLRTRRACANVLQNFEYEYYPYHSDLRAKVRRKVAELGGADVTPIGPPRFQSLRRFIGWRAAKRLQRALGR